jgi:NAD(P)-dependent dehydrogenase (short-subunit alcohol dehydrogenase family)
MARVFVTGSSTGLGLGAAEILAREGHAVTLHARTQARADDARRECRDAEGVVVGDLTTVAGMYDVAEQADRTGRFDAVIHNAAVGYREPHVVTPDRIEHVFAVNVLAPYLLTALLTPPERLVYLSSGMHRGGAPDLDDLGWQERPWSGWQAYSDSKLCDILLAFGVARHRPAVRSNAVDPGWVATRMGGPGAPGDITEGSVTQAWLAVSDDSAALVTGRYFHHRREQSPASAAHDTALQDALLERCAEITGVPVTGGGSW